MAEEDGVPQHVLLSTTRVFRTSIADLTPPGCVYDRVAGAWRFEEDGSFWSTRPDRRPPQTKKHDIETGEDQKGS